MARKFNQKVTATVYRFPCDVDGHILMRRNTQVHMGKSAQPLGAVIMSNPGSYAPKFAERDWEAYRKGEGDYQFEGWGFPDTSMQNIIIVLQAAAKAAGQALDGLIDVFNLSAVIQPKGKNAATYHSHALSSLSEEERRKYLFKDWMESQTLFQKRLLDSGYSFVIIGFLHDFLVLKQERIRQWTANLPHVIYATDPAGMWSHPYRWRADLELRHQIIDKLILQFSKGT